MLELRLQLRQRHFFQQAEAHRECRVEGLGEGFGGFEERTNLLYDAPAFLHHLFLFLLRALRQGLTFLYSIKYLLRLNAEDLVLLVPAFLGFLGITPVILDTLYNGFLGLEQLLLFQFRFFE